MPSILIATRNAHKVAEIRSILGDQVQLLSLADFASAPIVVEDQPTFSGNATKKAVELAAWVSTFSREARNHDGPFPVAVLADDSGLEVDALKGAPGVHSARFAGIDTHAKGNSADEANNAKLLRLLESVPWEKRTARFRCVLAMTPVVQ